MLHIDAVTALGRGVDSASLQAFDDLVVENAAEIMQAKGGSGR